MLALPMDDSRLDRISDQVFARLRALNGDITCLGEIERVLVVIYSAQGVIDNGGLRAFFGANWPGEPPYALHADAYRLIGATDTAEAIERGAASFALPRPEVDSAGRSLALHGTVGEEIDALELTPSDEVWQRLARYVERNASEAG